MIFYLSLINLELTYLNCLNKNKLKIFLLATLAFSDNHYLR